MEPKTIAIISAGGVIGSLARYLVSLAVQNASGSHFPYGTLVVNVTGCLLIGFVMKLAAVKADFPQEMRFFLVTGFAGAYTTFSTFEYETLALIENGRAMAAAANVVASNVIGLAAVASGSFLAARVV